ncbi:ABC transporter permease subunit, partial [Paenibacillus sp. 28ISP30-2]|nr:ABC transporter permease subunit [Paenibacillus sp. 28ISP30-2]
AIVYIASGASPLTTSSVCRTPFFFPSPPPPSLSAYASALSLHAPLPFCFILPQAVRIAIPPMGNTFVGMLKETSLVSVIGVSELMRQAQLLQAQYLHYMPFLLEIGIMYWIMSIGFSAILERVEKRLARAY